VIVTELSSGVPPLDDELSCWLFWVGGGVVLSGDVGEQCASAAAATTSASAATRAVKGEEERVRTAAMVGLHPDGARHPSQVRT
jgi:hypothetical protein